MSSQTPILCLHAALGSKKQMLPIQQLLIDNYNYPCKILNFEGHGGRPSDRAFSIDYFTENVRIFLIKEKIPQVHIVGYSMGGYVAVNLAKKHPGLVGKIITLGTKVAWDATTAASEVKKLNPDLIEEKVPKFAAYLGKVHGATNWKNMLKKTAAMMLDLGNGAALTETDLQEVAQAVFVGVGSQDNMVTVEESTWFADHLQQGNLHVFEDFQHPIERNDMAVFAAAIHAFIQQS